MGLEPMPLPVGLTSRAQTRPAILPNDSAIRRLHTAASKCKIRKTASAIDSPNLFDDRDRRRGTILRRLPAGTLQFFRNFVHFCDRYPLGIQRERLRANVDTWTATTAKIRINMDFHFVFPFVSSVNLQHNRISTEKISLPLPSQNRDH